MPYSQGWYYKEDLRRRRARDSELNNVAKEVAAVYHSVDPSIVAELTAPTRKHLEGPYSKDIPRTNALTYEAPKAIQAAQGAPTINSTNDVGKQIVTAGDAHPDCASGARKAQHKRSPNYKAAAARVLGAHMKARSLGGVD